MALPNIRLRSLSRFPARATGGNAISITKTNGVHTVSMNWSLLAALASISSTATQQLITRNTTTGVFETLVLSVLLSTAALTGAGIAIGYTVDTSSTADSDPGLGILKFNNAVQNAATVFYVDLFDNTGGGVDWTTGLDSLDDSTNTVKGTWSLHKVGDATKRMVGTLSAVTSAVGYRKLTVATTVFSSASPFANGDSVLFQFTRSGDAGGGGDVVGPASATDSGFAKFDGTTGKLLKNSAAIVAVADGGTGSGTAAGARTNLAAASTTQTAAFFAYIKTVANQDYRLFLKIPWGGTITETATRSVSGTCTATFKINTTALGGTANSVTSAEQSQAHSSANVFVTDDDVMVTVSANAACVDMAIGIKFTRTLA